MAITWKKIAYEDDVMLNTVADANAMLYSVSDNTPAALAMAASRIPARLAAGNIVAATVAEILTLIGVTSGADVTGSNPPQAHKDSHDPGGTDPLDAAAAAVITEVQAAAEGSAESWARSDHVHGIAHDITDNAIPTIDGTTNAPADDDVAVFTALGLEGQTPAQVAATMALDDVGVPDAAVDFDLQEATDLVVMTVANEAALPAANVAVGQLCWATGELTLHICTASA